MLNPIFAIFVANSIPNGSVEIAGTAVTVFLLARILTELFASRLLNNSSDRVRVWVTLIGMILLSGLYFSYVFITSIEVLFIVQIMIGFGFGIFSPAKLALFSANIDRGKESSEWGLYDVVTLSGMACTAMLGGFVANKYGFQVIFVITAIMMLFGAIPYVFFTRRISND